MKMALLSGRVFVVMINFQVSLAAVMISQAAPSYSPVCLGDTVIFTCTANSSGCLTWLLLDYSDNVDETCSVSVGNQSCSNIIEGINSCNNMLKPFKITKTDNGIFSSNATAMVRHDLNGVNISCSSGNSQSDNAAVTMRSPPIGLSVTALNDSAVNLTWSPPLNDSVCVAQYIINTITDTNETTTTNITTATSSIISHLSYNNAYNFTVAAVDKNNITGNYSEFVSIYLSIPNKVLNLTYNSNNDGTITVNWNSPIDNNRPDVTHYIIYTNMTDKSHVTSNATNYTLNDISTGSTYFISVSAVNVIGEGPNSTIYVSLDTSMTTIPSMSPTVSNSVTIIGATGGTFALIFGIIIILLIVISIIVCFSLKSKKGKKSSSLNLDTSQVDSMMITGNTSNPQPNVQEQTVPIYAEINKKQNPSVQEYSDNGPESNESIGQYFLLNNDVETPPIPPISPPANSTEAPLHSYEYSVVNKLYKKQSREQGSKLEQAVYAEVGDIKCNRPTIPDPPVSFPMEAAMYSEVMKPPKQLPGRDNVMLELEDITNPPPPIPPKTRL